MIYTLLTVLIIIFLVFGITISMIAANMTTPIMLAMINAAIAPESSLFDRLLFSLPLSHNCNINTKFDPSEDSFEHLFSSVNPSKVILSTSSVEQADACFRSVVLSPFAIKSISTMFNVKSDTVAHSTTSIDDFVDIVTLEPVICKLVDVI